MDAWRDLRCLPSDRLSRNTNLRTGKLPWIMPFTEFVIFAIIAGVRPRMYVKVRYGWFILIQPVSASTRGGFFSIEYQF